MKKHIVVIEDDSDLREVITLVLERRGYRVTALEALNTVEELLSYRADCFLIDENLPITTGHIICILLKSKPETKHLPVILMSASAQLSQHASLCEADIFLQKPFGHIDDVADAVEQLQIRQTSEI